MSEDWELMRSQITSTTQLEAAYLLVQPQVEALGLTLDKKDAQKILDLYNATVTDGRYIDDLVADPIGVARKLNVRISKQAAEALKQAGSIEAFRPEVQGWSQILIVAIVIVIVFGPHVEGTQVVDSSGIVKI
jgi:hypothetical protein